MNPLGVAPSQDAIVGNGGLDPGSPILKMYLIILVGTVTGRGPHPENPYESYELLYVFRYVVMP